MFTLTVSMAVIKTRHRSFLSLLGVEQQQHGSVCTGNPLIANDPLLFSHSAPEQELCSLDMLAPIQAATVSVMGFVSIDGMDTEMEGNYRPAEGGGVFVLTCDFNLIAH